MASTLKAIPQHLKPSAANGGAGANGDRHHGKSQSHVVSTLFLRQLRRPWFYSTTMGHLGPVVPASGQEQRPRFMLDSSLHESLHVVHFVSSART